MKLKSISRAILIASMFFLAIAPFSVPLAAIFGGLAYLSARYTKMPAGSLAIGAAGEPNADDVALLAKIKEQTALQIKESASKDPTITEFKALYDELKNAKTKEEINGLKAAIDKLVLDTKAENEKKLQQLSAYDTLGTSAAKAYRTLMTPEKVEAFINKKERGWQDIDFKAGTIVEANITPVGTGPAFSLTEFLPVPVRIQRRNPFVIQLLNVMRTVKKTIVWIEQNTPSGTVTGTAEANTKNQIDFAFTERKIDVQKYTGFIKVSREMLDDFPVIDALIRTELVTRIMLAIDTDALVGTGASNTITGIKSSISGNSSSNWTGGTTFAASVPYANYFDVLKIGINQVATNVDGDTNYSAGFEANIILMNPTDVTSMLIAKDTQGRYLRDLLTYPSSNVIELDGVRIVASTGVAQGYFYIMDASKVMFAMREDANISVGYDGNDFTQNLLTILCETRAALWIPTNYLGAVVYGYFPTAVASLRNAVS